ncbi:alpha/beta hydrolase [Shewanella sp. D64]|uniref:alpha/beta hydrolase n=1 Tax=unclassified Shewanella TaxID=196818 RepID=UPI0022BA2402|nr:MULTISPECIES: alpha/beta hydrolase [unclassified Shewanella]MEC4724422.1 alpha/beta hydrolase [Shewanella sp. D64]MEC4736801.1 alpha/beta hydrolase [Shewanella sp. E94]WBJ94538.1 alpha/beta hydrolase [Shewanella sp. MTB7]
MQLDPKVALFLQQLRDSGAQAYEDMTPAESRRLEMNELVKVQASRMLEPIATIEHSFIPGPTADLPIRIYRPESSNTDTLQPALIFIHGSGWVVSNIETNDHFSRALANRTGSVVIAINYQKAPEHKFPIPMDDCYASTLWIFEHAALLGLDAKRIGIFGDSAGGNLAAAVTLRLRDEAGPKLAYQVLVYPAVQYGWQTPSALANAEGYLLQQASMKYYWSHYLRSEADAKNPYCSPLGAQSHKDLPPTLIYTAEFDPLRDDGYFYAQKLRTCGVSVKYRCYNGVIHGFIKMLGVFDQAEEFLQELTQDLSNILIK